MSEMIDFNFSLPYRSSLGAVGVDGVGIYCSGGTDGAVCLSSVEKYNARRAAWEPMPAMQSKRWAQMNGNQNACMYLISNPLCHKLLHYVN